MGDESEEEVWAEGEAEDEEDSEDSDVDDGDALDEARDGLSHVGEAVRDALEAKHPKYKGICWNITYGKVVGELAQTPPGAYYQEEQITEELADSHSDYLPERMAEVIKRAEAWVDFTSLGPPDGRFLAAMASALRALHETGNSIVVRILTGNIIGMPTDNVQLVRDLTKMSENELPDDTNLKIWVGSWRKKLSWNHAKIIAVDGKYCFTGGHNVWDPHYLKKNPVRDLSFEVEGRVAQDGHCFANRMWKYIIRKRQQDAGLAGLMSVLPKLRKSKVLLARFPPGIEDYPPMFERDGDPLPLPEAVEQGELAMIPVGRFGQLHHDPDTANPADSAIVAMMASAQKSIRLCLQDLGPLAVPPPLGPIAVPGCVWPEAYLRELGLAIYNRGVDVEIVLSNPCSIPSDLGMTDANYGNGWTCNDVAAELIKSIKANVEDAEEERLSGLLGVNLRIAFMRSSLGPADWEERQKSGNHAKFFIVDDRCYYLGSQNLYIADLAEWGIIVDSESQTAEVLEQYWSKLWGASWENVAEEDRDFTLDEVMAGLDIDRNPRDEADYSPEELEAMLLAKKATHTGGSSNMLTVWVKKARNLRDADGLGAGSSDAYVRLRVVDPDGNDVCAPQQTRVLWDAGANPKWNEVLDFEGLDSPGAYTLKLSVLDKDSLLGLGGSVADWLAAEDQLGRTSVDLGALENSTSYQPMELVIDDGWFKDSTLCIAVNTRGGWGN